MTYDLGITTRVTSRISRRSFFATALALGAVAHSIPVLAQVSTPVSKAEGDADALTVLQEAVSKLMELETFTFSLTTTLGNSTIFPGVELQSVEGSIRRPTDMEATLKVKALIQTMSLGAVVVDGDFYLQDPLSGGSWRKMGSAPEIVTMINPDWLLLAALNLIQDAKITSERDGVTLIEGYMHLADELGKLDQNADMSAMAGVLATGPVDVAFWIDSDNYITQAEIYGPIFASESPDVEKRIQLDNFNEPVTIEIPKI